MKKYLFNVAAVISLMLAIFFSCIWIRGYRLLDNVHTSLSFYSSDLSRNFYSFNVTNDVNQVKIWIERRNIPRAINPSISTNAMASDLRDVLPEITMEHVQQPASIVQDDLEDEVVFDHREYDLPSDQTYETVRIHFQPWMMVAVFSIVPYGRAYAHIKKHDSLFCSDSAENVHNLRLQEI